MIIDTVGAIQRSAVDLNKLRPFLVENVVALGCFALVAMVCFLPSIKHVGFYLDDWIMLNTLSSGPQDFIDLFKHYFSADPRVVKRPIEALHFELMFKLFGVKPLGYHVFNLVMEILSTWLLFLCLIRVCGSRLISFIAAVFFLLYPSHNATHYWVVCSSVNLSMIFYLGSLLCDIEAVERKLPWLHAVSGLLFLLGLLNYEVFLLLGLLNIAVVAFLNRDSKAECFKAVLFCGGSLSVAFLLDLLYLRLVVPIFSDAWMHHVTFDSSLMWSTIKAGVELNLPWVGFDFFLNQAGQKWNDGISSNSWAMLVAVSLALFGSMTYFWKQDAAAEEASHPVWYLALGAMVVVASYVIFGLNDSYGPTFHSLVNRVNTGATIGIAFILCSIALGLRNVIGAGRLSFLIVSAVLVVPLITLLMLADWALAKPYLLSWQLQAHIRSCLKNQQGALKEAKSILLVNVPRYVNEAPVFDGVWDFQNVVRLTLDRSDIKGGVFSDRIEFAKDRILDAPAGVQLASYDIDGLFLIFSPQGNVVRVNDIHQLLNLVSSRGMQFESDKSLPERWRKQLEQPGESSSSVPNASIGKTVK